MYANLFNRGYIPTHLACVEKAGGANAIKNKWNQTNIQVDQQPVNGVNGNLLQRSYSPANTVVQPYAGPV